MSGAFVLFYLMTVFALAWGTSALGYSRENPADAVVHHLFFALTIPLSAILAERGGGAPCCGSRIDFRFRLVMAPMFVAGTAGRW